MPNSKEPDFEHGDNEKLARLIAYIPAVIHVQNIIKIAGPYGSEIGGNPKVYNDAVESAALKFYSAAVHDTEAGLQTELD